MQELKEEEKREKKVCHNIYVQLKKNEEEKNIQSAIRKTLLKP